jgi:LSD1 subclass zinc finger protein
VDSLFARTQTPAQLSKMQMPYPYMQTPGEPMEGPTAPSTPARAVGRRRCASAPCCRSRRPAPAAAPRPPRAAIQPGPHSHITCGGCQTLLMYPQQGASNVRCSRCGHITAAPPAPPPDPNQAQTVCNGCRVLLAFPRGAQSVQCSLCHTVTQVRGHVRAAALSMRRPSGRALRASPRTRRATSGA